MKKQSRVTKVWLMHDGNGKCTVHSERGESGKWYNIKSSSVALRYISQMTTPLKMYEVSLKPASINLQHNISILLKVVRKKNGLKR